MRAQGEILAACARLVAHRARRPDARRDLFADYPRAAQPEAGSLPPAQLRAPISHPVDEKQDVARLLLDDRLEDRHEPRGEITRVARECKQPEREEGIEALAEAGEQKIALQRARLEPRRRLDGNPIVRGQRDEQPRVPVLLEPLQLDGRAQPGIGFELRGSGYGIRRDVLGGYRFLPERQAGESRALGFLERRPLDLLGDVIDMRVEEEPRKHVPVLGGADADFRRLNICRSRAHAAALCVLPSNTMTAARARRTESRASVWRATGRSPDHSPHPADSRSLPGRLPGRRARPERLR